MPWIPNEQLEDYQALQYAITLLERIEIMADRLDRNVQNQLSQTAAYRQLAEEAQARATELQALVDQLNEEGSVNVELVAQLQQQVNDLQGAIDRNNEALESDDSPITPEPGGDETGGETTEPVTETPEPVPAEPETGEPVVAPDTGEGTFTDPNSGEVIAPDEGNLATPPPPGT